MGRKLRTPMDVGCSLLLFIARGLGERGTQAGGSQLAGMDRDFVLQRAGLDVRSLRSRLSERFEGEASCSCGCK